MKELEIDIETRSDRDITKCGVYAYADSPYFAVTLFSVSVDGGEVVLYDLASGEKIPDEILRALADESIVKRAFNVNFERVCLSRYLRDNYPQYFRSYSIDADTVSDYLSPVGWQCTMIHCRTLGLPSHLADAGAVLKLDQQKMPEGKALIKYFCVPYETIDGVPQFHAPSDAPEKWATFKAYNKQDVEAELAIDRRLEKFPVPDEIWEQFYLDQEINDRGIRVDMELVRAALNLDAQAKETLSTEMRRLTGVENPNSVYQLLDWLESQGYASDSLGKKEVKELLKNAEEPVKSVLQLRLQLSKSSVKKYGGVTI
jgi:DNA polymerase